MLEVGDKIELWSNGKIGTVTKIDGNKIYGTWGSKPLSNGDEYRILQKRTQEVLWSYQSE